MLRQKVCREIMFRKAMRRFLEEPETCTNPDSSTVRDLIYGWGNRFWSARNEYLAACIDRALKSPGASLECGSGLTTVLLGAIAKKRGHQHWALEHTPKWAERVQFYLNKYRLNSVKLCSSPLRDYGDYRWYDAPLEQMREGFSLVICDGPPGRTKGGRYGLVPVMKERFNPGCIILLDDAGRRKDFATSKRWETELGASYELLGSRKPFAEMRTRG